MSCKPILCLDFDGVIHSYSSGWQGADCIPDPVVPGAIDFIVKAVEIFTVSIFSSRSNQRMGIEAMQFYLKLQFYRRMEPHDADPILSALQWPKEKPPAVVTIDDRALTFSGRWADYDPSKLLTFQPWNKRPDPASLPGESTDGGVA